MISDEQLKRVNKQAIELIKQFEGFSPTVYLDQAGISTIGYGSTSLTDEELKGKVITELEATEKLQEHINKHIYQQLKKLDITLEDYELIALISFIYNIGFNAFQKSTLLKLIKNNVSKKVVAYEFLRWKYVNKKISKGLERRREQERKTFLNL